MKSKSIHGNSISEIEVALSEIRSDGFNPVLAVVFVSVKQDIQAISDLFIARDIDCIGATSCNEFTNGHQSEGGAVALLFEVNKAHYKLLFEDIGHRSIYDAAAGLAKNALDAFSNPALILLSTSIIKETGSVLEGETIIRALEKNLGSETNIFGGMAGDDLTFQGTQVFINGRVGEYAIAAIVWNEDFIRMYGVALSGWKPIGVTKTITKSKNNLIYEIDSEPALKTYLRYLGEDADNIDDKIKFFESIGMHYPFQLLRSGREPMMCSPMGYNKDEDALVMESNIEQGSRFRFSTPPDFDIAEAVIQKAKEIRALNDFDGDAVLIFSCASRLYSLGPIAEQENNGIAQVWNAPMAGYYSYGEFGRAINGNHEFHSTTCSWVALKENEGLGF